MSTLAFKELSVSRPSTANSSSSGGSDSGRYCDIVKVDVLENSHWTDLVCKVDDVQYDQTVEGLKSRFAALQGAKSGGGEDVGRKRKLVDTLSKDKA